MSKLNCVSTPEQLTYNGEVFPSIVVFDSPSNYNAETWVQSHKHAIERSLQLSGAVLFRGFPVTSAEDFDAFSAAFGLPTLNLCRMLFESILPNASLRLMKHRLMSKSFYIMRWRRHQFLHPDCFFTAMPRQKPVAPRRYADRISCFRS